MPPTLRVAIMGTGKIAGKVTPYIQRAAGCTVTLAASRSADRSRGFADGLGIPAACTYDQLATRDDIDAVYVTLPNHAHPEWADRLLRAGKHVLCEKPLCWTRAQAERLFTTAAELDRVLVEAFMSLHAPLMPEMAAIARAAIADPDASPIGRLTRIEAAFNYPTPPGPSDNVRFSRALAGGALMDVGCYPLSFARAVLGFDPAAPAAETDPLAAADLAATAEMVDLYADSPNNRTDSVDGRCTITGATTTGVQLDLTCSMIEDPADGPTVYATLIGDRGRAHMPDLPRPERIKLTTPAGPRTIASPLADPFDAYRLQAESFAKAAAGTGKPLPSPAWSIAHAATMEHLLDQIGLRFTPRT